MKKIIVLFIMTLLSICILGDEENTTKTTTTIKLPPPNLKGTLSVEEAIYQRRTVRSYEDKGLTIEQLSQLLWSAQGITDSVKKHRAAPSAGGLYPLDLWIVIDGKGVKDLKPGIYKYLPEEHSIKLVKEGYYRSQLLNFCVGQTWFSTPIIFVITAEPKRIDWKYEERTRQYIFIEVGSVAENIQLQAVAINLASGLMGAYQDDKISKMLDLPKDNIVTYVIPVGYKK